MQTKTIFNLLSLHNITKAQKEEITTKENHVRIILKF